jgi:uncharacterized repeat protein (TIGR03803 family)
MPIEHPRSAAVAIRCLAIFVPLLILLAPRPASSATLQTIYTFCITGQDCTDGGQPETTLLMDSQGRVYGTTYHGGDIDDRNNGTAFRLTSVNGGWTYKRLHSFCHWPHCNDGQLPLGKLIVDTAGNLYGTTSGGGRDIFGTVFELSRDETKGWRVKILHDFAHDGVDGINPLAGLTYAGQQTGAPYDGVSPLYGTASQGGSPQDAGAVFSLTPVVGKSKWREKILFSFCSQSDCADGQYPQADLSIDDAGNLYGTTQYGGGHDIDPLQRGGGTVFMLSRSHHQWVETVLHAFCALASCADGDYPAAPLSFDASGNLYGTTQGHESTLFKLVPDGVNSQLTVLFAGGVPEGALAIDPSGDIFGILTQDGDFGSVFEYNGALQTLYKFCALSNCADGAHPVGGLIRDAGGHLFGETSGGGSINGAGTVFELTP